MIQDTNNYADVVIKASDIKHKLENTEYSNLLPYVDGLIKYSMMIMRGELSDPNDKLYYQVAKPLYISTKTIDIRGVKTKAYKILELLCPISVMQKRINDDIQYQYYKQLNNGRR